MTLVPFIVLADTKDNTSILHACLAHKKSAEKTLETGILWHVHPSTATLIPAEPAIAIQSVHKQDGWYIARARGDVTHFPISPVDGNANNDTSVPHALPSSQDADMPLRNNSTEETARFLFDLYALVSERNATRPEGSYTTHLFTAGEDKIRKKLGEEVIELILSRSSDEMIAEASDLLYHLIVLLVHNGIALESCIAVLQSRHRYR